MAMASGLAKSGSWRMGFDRNSYFRLLKDACISVVQSHRWSFLIRSRRGASHGGIVWDEAAVEVGKA